MEWTLEHEHACWDLLGRWLAAGRRDHARVCTSRPCTCRKRAYDELVGRRLLPFVSAWLDRTPLAFARFNDDDRQLILVDVHERLAVGDGKELRLMAEACGIVATPDHGPAATQDEALGFVVNHEDQVVDIEPGEACAAMALTRSDLLDRTEDPREGQTPVQRQLRALYQFALLRRCQQRLPSSLRPEQRRPPRRFRFTNAAQHAGTRTLEHQLSEALEASADPCDLDKNRRYLAVLEVLAAMPKLQLRVYAAYLFGQMPRDIARQMHLAYADVDRMIDTAKRAVARAIASVPDED